MTLLNDYALRAPRLSLLDRLRKRASKPLYHPNPFSIEFNHSKDINIKNNFYLSIRPIIGTVLSTPPFVLYL